jgi:methionyl-tRNA formyltransferase
MRLIFMGSPDFAVPTLAALIEAGHEIACVYSQPARPAGRGKKLTQTPVAAFAEARGLPVRTPESLRGPEPAADFAALQADAAVVVAYGLILPKSVLAGTRLGCFNLHGSLLPRWRGAAPIHRAIEAGDAVTGVQAMRMEAGLDTGPVLDGETLAIFPFDTAGTLHDRMAAAGAGVMVRALAALEAGTAVETPQAAAGVTYAAKIERAETRIDWSQPAAVVDRRIRAFAPAPGAWCEGLDGAGRLKILLSRAEEGTGPPGTVLDDKLLVACGTGAVRLLSLQKEGRGALDAEAFLRGQTIGPGDRFA